jgi:hypothetical protein
MQIVAVPVPLREIDTLLSTAFELVVHAEQTSLACALDELGDITLPPGGATAADAAHLRTVASLYLAAELELAMLLPAAETLAGLAGGGGLPGDPDPATARKLASFWEARHRRSSPEERRALYGRLFGSGPAAQALPADTASRGGPNEQFEPLLIDLCEALYKLDEQGTVGRYGGPGPEVRLATAARRLADNLVQHAGGMALFMARDILATMREALDLLRRPDLVAMFQARDWRGLVETVAQRYLRAQLVDVQTHLERAGAGTTILAWLSSIAPSLAGATPPMVAIDDPAIVAAATWLQTSLHLGEQAQSASATAQAYEIRSDDRREDASPIWTGRLAVAGSRVGWAANGHAS